MKPKKESKLPGKTGKPINFLYPSLFVAKSPGAGRGVFTTAPIPEGTLLEIAPVIVFPPDQIDLISQTLVNDYYFQWGEKDDHGALALGYGSVYNHDQDPNADYVMYTRKKTIEYFAIRDIAAGEEITISYTVEPDNLTGLWFTLR